MTAISKIAEFITRAVVPEKTLSVARSAFVDTVGCMLAGSVEPAAKIVQKLAATEAGNGSSRVLGTDLSVNAGWAALANGTAGHALDYDDMCFVSLAHPSAPLVSALLALGEKIGAPGKKLLEAYVIGFEIEGVLGRMMNPRHYQSGWHCTSTIGTLGSSAACARLLNLDAKATANCMAIAASSALGLKENFGTMTKPLHAGVAAQNSVMAALLAQNGFTASEKAIDGPQGLLIAMASEHQEGSKVFADLGRRWEILETGITVKLYPSCAATHPALDAVLDLRHENDLKPEQIENVEVHVDSIVPTLLIYNQPQTGLEGKFSMPFCAAAALVDGQVGLDTFELRVHDPAIRELMTRVTMKANHELGKDAPALTQALINISCRDGRKMQRAAKGARGYPANPASEEELRNKFMTCAQRAISASAAEGLYQQICTLESIADIRQINQMQPQRTLRTLRTQR